MWIKFYNPNTKTLTLSNTKCCYQGDIRRLIANPTIKFKRSDFFDRFEIEYLGWY